MIKSKTMEDSGPVFCDTGSQDQTKRITHCRFCAQEKKYGELRDLNIDKETWKLFLNILEFFKIDFINLSNIHIPKTTCETCYNTMLKCYNFFQNVKESQTILNELYVVKDENDEDNVQTVMGIGSEAESPAYKQADGTTIKSRKSLKDSIIYNQTQAYQDEEHELKTEEINNDKKSNSPRELEDNFDNPISANTQELDDNWDNLSPSSRTSAMDYFPMTYCGFPIFNDAEATEDHLDNSLNANTQELDDNCDNLSTSSSSSTNDQQLDGNDNISISSSTSAMDYFPMTYCGFPIFNDAEAECNDTIENKCDNDSWATYPWCCKHCQVECDSMDDLRSHSVQLHKKCYAFKCDDCDNLIYYTFNSFIEHVRQHRDELSYYCPHCNEQFESVSDCTNHTLTHWSEGQRICEWCGKIFPDESAFKLHKRMSQPVRQSKNLLRRKPRVSAPVRMYNGIPVFENESNIQSDFKTWDDYLWTCRDCLLRFTSAQLLRTHTQDVHGKCFSMKCIDCPIELRTYNRFVVHVTGHRPQLRSYCPYCNEHLKPEEFTKHINNHLKSSLKPCYECGQIFENKLLASQHNEKFEPLRRDLTIEELTCEVCASVFNTLARLKTHKKTHDKNREKEHICDTCGKQFFTQSALKYHLTSHDGDKKHICKVCDKGFMNARYLKKHVQLHLNNNKFICDYCTKSFGAKFKLRNHITRVHTRTNSKFKCKICSKSVCSSGNMKNHMRIHTGERPYKCLHCEKSFANWSNCNKHMVRIHKTSLSNLKVTERGRIPVEKIAKVMNITADTEQWMQKVVKYRRKKGAGNSS